MTTSSSKNYWREMYGSRSADFIEGVIAGVSAYAVWVDGQQWVGSLEYKLEDVIEEIKEGLE